MGAKLENGVARIQLSKAPQLTGVAVLTSGGTTTIVTARPAVLYVASITPDELVVKGLSGDSEAAFFFHLTGIRNDMVKRTTAHYRRPQRSEYRR